MLNRTNRTLTANLNRLNLGTRSLAVKANGFNGMATLRLRQTEGDRSRDGMTGIPHPEVIRHPEPMWMSSYPCSSPSGPWCSSTHYEPKPVVVVPVKVLRPAARQDFGSFGRGVFQVQSQALANARLTSTRPATSGRQRVAVSGVDLGRTRVRATRPAAASYAAAGG